MRIADTSQHTAQPWRCHALAPDFVLNVLWELPVELSPGDSFEDFYRLFAQNGIATDSPITQALFAVRLGLGKLLGWNDPKPQLTIPGTAQRSVRVRMTREDEAQNQADAIPLPDLVVAHFDAVYRFENEALLEVQNATIHALLHLGAVEVRGGRRVVRMAIYLKYRGLGSRLYMAAITPFRYGLVYPALGARLGRLWAARHANA